MSAVETLTLPFPWPNELIHEFCRRWRIEELAVLGSALRLGGHLPTADHRGSRQAPLATVLRGALGIGATRKEDLDEALARVLALPGPSLVEVLTDPELV